MHLRAVIFLDVFVLFFTKYLCGTTQIFITQDQHGTENIPYEKQ